jgi:MFS transporter, SP family, general alpha glucoside:H+ symporter
MKRLSSNTDENSIRDTIALMVETTELERSMTEGATYWDCFKGNNLWRIEIGCLAWSSQVLVGFGLSSYAAYFYEQAGLPATSAYKMTVGQGGLHSLCTWFSSQHAMDAELFYSGVPFGWP